MGRKKVIFYLIDGARPDILTRLVEKGELPQIQRYLVDAGSYTKGTTCMPSTTGPAYLPFLTGYHPAEHHITGIRWFDKKEYFEKGRWSRNSMRSYCGYEAKYFNDDMDPAKPSLFEEIEDGFNIYNMITKGVKEENDLTKKGKTGLYFKAHFYHKHHPVDQAGHLRLMDSLEKDPEFVFAVFPSIDWDSHTYHFEDERTIQSYKIADDSLGEVIERLKQKGEYNDTLIVMASDHGLSSTHTHLDLGSFFKSEGYRVLEYPSIFTINPKVSVTISGNSFASISFLDDKEIYTQKSLMTNHGVAIDNLVQQAATDFVLVKVDEHTFCVKNREGEAIVSYTASGLLTYRTISADPWKLGGELENISVQESYERTFESEYPDCLYQTVQLMKSHRAGDLVLNATTGYDFRDFWEIPEHKGSHGSLHWEHMHVPVLTNQKDLITTPIRTSDIHTEIKNWLNR